jgi:pentatricopeptide repeat protein
LDTGFSQAGLPLAAVEVFHTMEHMNCDPDRASFDILIDAFGKAGFIEGIHESLTQLLTVMHEFVILLIKLRTRLITKHSGT